MSESIIKSIIKNAGSILRYGYYESQRFKEKEKGHLLSEYDEIIDNYLIKEIKNKFPLCSFYTEEKKEMINKSDTKWIIDPIDGSAYFIFGEPYFSISAAKEENGVITEAHVYNPISDEYFYSDNEINISFLNENEITVSDVNNLEETLAAFGFSANINAINKYYNEWKNIIDRCKKGIAWICPALSICNVARGRLELFIDFGASYEGQSAASLILKNAGGKMLNYDRSDYSHKIKGGIFYNGKIEI
ncbi:MAG: hypothetical protein JXB50_04460 [Spirochaetes bacterium]|nr:hypothetical protein [Spirochaetota bacterium]